MWGHTVSDLQTSVAVANGAITGTLSYISTGALPDVWGPGNFLALKFTLAAGADPETVRIGLDPSVSSGLLPLDEDKNAVCKITDKDGQKFIVETFNGSYWHRDEYDLSGLTVLDE